MQKKIIDKKILNLALDTSNYGLKNKSNYLASLKSKKCGDRIKVELKIKNKIIERMYYETESCIFCQASANLLSKKVKNLMINNLNKIFFSKKFKFLLSKKYISRKECVMLPFQALKKALQNHKSKTIPS
tara:strand:+ start:936 stop:1325 length:390 start_codon:yes stop_codon:yes gene_type:complete